jgi:hypothetical protein
MKLRINGNSIRLRLLRSEVTMFVETGHIEQTIHFASGDHALLIYGLEYESDLADVELRYKPSEVVIVLPRKQAVSWAETDQIGIYSAVDLGRHGSLDMGGIRDRPTSGVPHPSEHCPSFDGDSRHARQCHAQCSQQRRGWGDLQAQWP